MNDRYVTDHFAFIGRTFKEYRDMFALTDGDLNKGKVLDCPSGAASFVAEARVLGIEATACDAIYCKGPEALATLGAVDIQNITVQLPMLPHLYTFGEYYPALDNLIALRESALGLFLDDYRANTGRYVEASLPRLPFGDKEFSMALVGHFLFLYGDRLDQGFHIDSLRELLRVSDEVRVFPLAGLDARPSAHLDGVLRWADASGLTAEVIEVPLRFQRGGGKILRIRR